MDTRIIARFWSKVQRTATCWLWEAGADGGGYGNFKFLGKQWQAHRVAWFLYRGEIPDGLKVCHTCDTPACVRPSHLFVGTQKQNMEDRGRKGRTACGLRMGKHTHPEAYIGSHRGTRNGRSKLTELQVRCLRFLYRYGDCQTQLAHKFDLHQATVSAIIRRKLWAHV